MSEIRFSPVAVAERQCYDVTETSNDVTKNDVTSAVKIKRTDIEASLPISCDLRNDDVTPVNLKATMNDVTTDASLNCAQLQLDDSVASLPISCDVCNDDVIVTPDVCHDEVNETKRENIENSVDAGNDYSFWIHVSEFVET